jgi:hypothetical protein
MLLDSADQRDRALLLLHARGVEAVPCSLRYQLRRRPTPSSDTAGASFPALRP